MPPPKIVLDHRWPQWKRRCESFSWRTGAQCKAWSTIGYNHCRKHGGGGIHKEKAWRRYLLWVLLPDTIKHTMVKSPFTDDEIEVAANIIAQYVVTGDSHASEGVRMKAIEYLFDSVTVENHPHPQELLTHLSKEDASEAIRILRLNGLIK